MSSEPGQQGWHCRDRKVVGTGGCPAELQGQEGPQQSCGNRGVPSRAVAPWSRCGCVHGSGYALCPWLSRADSAGAVTPANPVLWPAAPFLRGAGGCPRRCWAGLAAGLWRQLEGLCLWSGCGSSPQPCSPSREAYEEGDGHGQAAARQDPEDSPEREAAALVAPGTLPPSSGPPPQ